jgi:uncharacterized HAD superfamily protein/adenine/guanine phosphoribosyltransferase-like PRPP-binding protein
LKFRSFEDLAATVRGNLHRIPHDIDVVVGVPRSGMFPAGMLALHRNATLTDIDGFLEGRALQHGIRREKPRIRASSEMWQNVLVVDDSVVTGGTMANIRARIAAAGGHWKVLYCAIYGVEARHPQVDLTFDVCPLPRAFEWNLMHHPACLANACMDIDGLLCVDPTIEENDDGPRYERFLQEADPNLLPTVPVGTLVSSRLEKCRAATEGWLAHHGVQYGELHLLDLPSAEARRRLKAHAPFKADVYRSKKDSWLFLESDLQQARAIAAQTGKAVVCTSEMIVFDETGPQRAVRIIRRNVGAKRRYLSRLGTRLRDSVLRQERDATDHH